MADGHTSKARTVARPAQGVNSTPKAPPRAAYVAEAAPAIVSRGTVSRPKPLGKWNPKILPQDRPGRIVQR
jgi:hypothetical protein